MSAPRVSCLVLAYNCERYIEEALESVLGQDYPADALQIVVVDDGSTDGTPERIARFRDRIVSIRKPNEGYIPSVNRALAEADGEYIARLDGDDVWRPDKLRRQVELLESRPEVGLVYSDMEVIDGSGGTIHPSYFRLVGIEPRRGRVLGELMKRNLVAGGCQLVRASLRERFFPMPADFVSEDGWWAGYCVAQVAELDYVPESVYRYRRHDENMDLGATGAGQARRALQHAGFLRRLLRLPAVEQVGLADLAEAWEAFSAYAHEAARLARRPLDELVRVEDADRAAAREWHARGLAAGDDAAARCFVRALSHDPWHEAGRELARLVATSLPQAPPPPVASPESAGQACVEGARSFATLALAKELVEHPELLRAYASVFDGRDDATLVVYAPDRYGEQLDELLGPALAAAGLDREGSADLLAITVGHDDRIVAALQRSVDAVLSRVMPLELLIRPRFGPDDVGELRALAERRWAQAEAA